MEPGWGIADETNFHIECIRPCEDVDGPLTYEMKFLDQGRFIPITPKDGNVISYLSKNSFMIELF